MQIASACSKEPSRAIWLVPSVRSPGTTSYIHTHLDSGPVLLQADAWARIGSHWITPYCNAAPAIQARMELQSAIDHFHLCWIWDHAATAECKVDLIFKKENMVRMRGINCAIQLTCWAVAYCVIDCWSAFMTWSHHKTHKTSDSKSLFSVWSAKDWPTELWFQSQLRGNTWVGCWGDVNVDWCHFVWPNLWTMHKNYAAPIV